MFTYYDPFVVDSICQGYLMPGALPADNAAAAQELTRRGLSLAEVAERLYVTERSVSRLLTYKFEPLPPLPDWADDYEREWPRCKAGHELTPDNVYRGSECRWCVRDRNRERDRARAREKVS